MKHHIFFLTGLWAIIFLADCSSNKTDYDTGLLRSRQNFDDGWQFTLSENADITNIYADTISWKKVHLPHDWSIEGGFDENNISGKRGGFFPGGIGWYKKDFSISDDQKAKRVIIEFDGVYKDADIWVNNQHVGFHK